MGQERGEGTSDVGEGTGERIREVRGAREGRGDERWGRGDGERIREV